MDFFKSGLKTVLGTSTDDGQDAPTGAETVRCLQIRKKKTILNFVDFLRSKSSSTESLLRHFWTIAEMPVER